MSADPPLSRAAAGPGSGCLLCLLCLLPAGLGASCLVLDQSSLSDLLNETETLLLHPAPSPMDRAGLLAKLQALSIESETLEHEAVMTCDAQVSAEGEQLYVLSGRARIVWLNPTTTPAAGRSAAGRAGGCDQEPVPEGERGSGENPGCAGEHRRRGGRAAGGQGGRRVLPGAPLAAPSAGGGLPLQ